MAEFKWHNWIKSRLGYGVFMRLHFEKKIMNQSEIFKTKVLICLQIFHSVALEKDFNTAHMPNF